MSVSDRDQLSAALLDLEERFNWEPVSMRRRALEIEGLAHLIGDELLAVRAQLCQANLQMRAGDIPGAAQAVWKVYDWAERHEARQLRARTHLVLANVHRHLGDAARCLEYSVLSVELLTDSDTPFMRIWHRTKLADALGLAGSMDEARLRYAQTEDLAVALHQPRLLMAMLNNYAYTELIGGDPARAMRVSRRLVAYAERNGFDLEPASLDTIGAIAIENGRYDEAELTMQRCIARHWEGTYEDADALAEYLLTLAQAQRGLGATARAQVSLDASRKLSEERELGDVLVRVHLEQSELHAARGEFAEAFAEHKVFFAAHNALHSAQREAQARTRQVLFETAEARRDAERFREQARRDPLTGLRNRRYIDEKVPGLIAGGGELALAIVDLDHFKHINDELSHDVGDQVLIRVAKLLEANLAGVTPDGFAARLGGEEFLLVLPGVPVEAAARHVDEIRRTVRSYDWVGLTRGVPVTVSVGVAGLSDAASATQAGLLSIADHNLYVAKHAGRDRVVAGSGPGAAARSYTDGVSAA